MDKPKRNNKIADSVLAPGMAHPEDAFVEEATQIDIEKEESTRVTRLAYDEYDPSEK